MGVECIFLRIISVGKRLAGTRPPTGAPSPISHGETPSVWAELPSEVLGGMHKTRIPCNPNTTPRIRSRRMWHPDSWKEAEDNAR